jgi:hypothetical protein
MSVALALAGKGLEAFLPLYTTVRLSKDRDKKLQLPLFPLLHISAKPSGALATHSRDSGSS